MRVRTGLALVPVLLLACGDGHPPPAGQEGGVADTGASDVDAASSPMPCDDDLLGNLTQARSHELPGSTRLTDLKLCPGRDDWFRLDAREAATLSVTACRESGDAVEIDFGGYREEFGQLYRHTNCASSGGPLFCVGTCQIEAPGIYYFRVSAPEQVRYSFGVMVTRPESPVIQNPPGFDLAPVLQPGTAREVTVCAPLSKWYQLQITEPSTVTIESTLTYAGFYLDFTLTAEGGQHLAYWPQDAGKTRHQQALDPGRYMLRARSALSGCRMFTLNLTRTAR